jgi:hypothetical protein
MLDPLRSLAELVRTLTRPRAQVRSGTSEVQRHQPSDAPQSAGAPVGGIEQLRERLRQRLRAVGAGDRRRVREAFVETVIASELGDAVTLDPAMADVVGKVAQQLGNDPATERDLGLLIDELVREAR